MEKIIIGIILTVVVGAIAVGVNTVAPIPNKMPNSVEDFEHSEYSIEYYLENEDRGGFLKKTMPLIENWIIRDNNDINYVTINSYNDYLKMYNNLEQMGKELINRYVVSEDIKSFLQNNPSKPAEEMEKWVKIETDSYIESVNERIKIIKEGFEKGNFDKSFFDDKSLVLVEDITLGSALLDIEIDDVCFDNGTLNIYMNKDFEGVIGGGIGTIYFITVNRNIDTVNIVMDANNSSQPGIAYKPIIYLYPEKDMKVNVSLANHENITVSYPKYNMGWDVMALKNSTLIDLKTNRNLYALYYECENLVNFNMQKEGFIVKGEDTVEFLEEKLAILGLNERESEEFIIYWLPQLQNNKFNYIRFATQDEIDKNMPLEVNPKADTVIRVLMTYKGLTEPFEVIEQELEAPKRNGFTVVEWGGTELK